MEAGRGEQVKVVNPSLGIQIQDFEQAPLPFSALWHRTPTNNRHDLGHPSPAVWSSFASPPLNKRLPRAQLAFFDFLRRQSLEVGNHLAEMHDVGIFVMHVEQVDLVGENAAVEA